MESLSSYINKHTKIVVDQIIRLGPIDFRLVSNVAGFPALQYFSKTARSSYQKQKTPFELWCISLKNNSINRQYLLAQLDYDYRGNSFLNGYYATDHFGAPLYLITRGQKYFVFGEHLERVVWPYFVKYFLILHAIQDKSLFLKSAACTIGTSGALLIGRGGAGKTVFLTQLCQHGAKFITNSHSIIKNNRIMGVASSLRIRPGFWYSNLIEKIEKKRALNPGEIIIDPYDVFDIYAYELTKVKNICIIDFQRPGRNIIKEVSKEDAYNYAEQFSLSINVYRLEEDILDLYKNDYQEFSQAYNEMKIQLKDLIRQSRCYYIGSDIFVPAYRDKIFDLLSR